MNNCKKTALICLVGIFGLMSNGFSQDQNDTRELKSFDKIIVSPRVELELVSGNQESIRLEYENIDASKVNVIVKGKTLRIYLDNAKYIVKNDKRYRYKNSNGWWDRRMYKEDVKVKAYVTYKSLKNLQVRGTEDIEVKSTLDNDRFKLKLYGESVVRIESLETKKFKAVLIGENRLDIKDGKAKKQKYKSIGENWVRADGLDSDFAKASMIGEGVVKLKVDDHLRISTIGEAQIVFSGNPIVRKGIILGQADIRKDW